MCGIRDIWWPWTSWVGWNVNFATLSICITKTKYIPFGYRHDGNGWAGVAMCLKAWAQVKALFANCEGIVSWTPNDMFGLTFDGSIQNVAIETLNLLVETKFVSISKMEWAQISTPLENHT